MIDCTSICSDVCCLVRIGDNVFVCMGYMRVVASSAGSVLVYLRCCLFGILPVGVSVVLFGWLV